MIIILDITITVHVTLIILNYNGMVKYGLIRKCSVDYLVNHWQGRPCKSKLPEVVEGGAIGKVIEGLSGLSVLGHNRKRQYLS